MCHDEQNNVIRVIASLNSAQLSVYKALEVLNTFAEPAFACAEVSYVYLPILVYTSLVLPE